MPYTKRQQRFFGADLARARRGEKTETGMSEAQLRKHAKGPLKKKKKKRSVGDDYTGRYY